MAGQLASPGLRHYGMQVPPVFWREQMHTLAKVGWFPFSPCSLALPGRQSYFSSLCSAPSITCSWFSGNPSCGLSDLRAYSGFRHSLGNLNSRLARTLKVVHLLLFHGWETETQAVKWRCPTSTPLICWLLF